MKVKVNHLKMRVKQSMFAVGNGVFKHHYYIEVNIVRNKWLPYGNDNGIVKFNSREEAEIEIQKLKETEEAK